MEASKVFDVGPDSLSECELSQIPNDRLWVVVFYECYSYEGDGLAAALRPDGVIEYQGLGHCSCYGPVDDWNPNTISLQEFLTYEDNDPDMPGRKRSARDSDFWRWTAVVTKVRELVTEKT